MRILVALVTLLLVSGLRPPVPARAGGRPAPRGDLIESIQALLRESPALHDALSGIELLPLGHSAYLWPEVPSPLAGTRVGPYSILARPLGAPGAASLQVVISTSITYLDASGAVVSGPAAAATVEQTVESLEIIPLAPPDPDLMGAWRLQSASDPTLEWSVAATWTFGPLRRFESVEQEPDGGVTERRGYFLNGGGELTLYETDSATFESYAYSVDGDVLSVTTPAGSGWPALESTFVRK
ncbi:MAG: hypothetical protein PVF43_16340 [Candidatus Eiseniibacteriota bacterium]